MFWKLLITIWNGHNRSDISILDLPKKCESLRYITYVKTNKAGYTATEVAWGWAGAIFEYKCTNKIQLRAMKCLYGTVFPKKRLGRAEEKPHAKYQRSKGLYKVIIGFYEVGYCNGYKSSKITPPTPGNFWIQSVKILTWRPKRILRKMQFSSKRLTGHIGPSWNQYVCLLD